MATFNVTVKMDPADVAGLKAQGYSLYGFKAVKAAGSGAPTVWFNLDKNKLLTETKITWEEQFEGYNSTSQIQERVQIVSSNKTKTDLGHLITIKKGSGNLQDSTDGLSGAVSFLNEDSQQFTVGILQVVEGGSNILCAFPILGTGGSRVITPITKVALIFSTAQINTGVVITKAMSSGALIDLTGVSSRTVDFSLTGGWSAGSAPWLKTFNAFQDMSSLLIESPHEAEIELSQRYE